MSFTFKYNKPTDTRTLIASTLHPGDTMFTITPAFLYFQRVQLNHEVERVRASQTSQTLAVFLHRLIAQLWVLQREKTNACTFNLWNYYIILLQSHVFFPVMSADQDKDTLSLKRNRGNVFFFFVVAIFDACQLYVRVCRGMICCVQVSPLIMTVKELVGLPQVRPFKNWMELSE